VVSGSLVRSLLVSFRIKGNHIRCRSASSSIIIVRKYLREIILNFHGIGEPPSHVPDEERPYWISIKYFSDVVRSRLDVAPKFYPVLSSLVTF
jgi:hypothetical protein